MSVELATGYVSLVSDTSKIPKQLNEAFGTAGDAAGKLGGSKASDGLLGGLKGIKGGQVGALLGGAFAVAGVSAAGLFVKSLQSGLEREKIMGMTQARLGVDDATMAKIGVAAGRSYAAGFGESVESNLKAAQLGIQGGLIDPNATAQDAQKIMEQLQGVNDLIGGDLTETTKAAGILLKNDLVGNASDAFDTIVAGYRSTGLQGDDLIDSLKEYSSGWKNTGLDAKEAVALISQSLSLGVDNTDRGADALREFGRRVTEEGDTIVSTLDSIGLNGTEMFKAFKKGGPEGFAAFDKTFDTIREIEDPVKRNAAAMALLGDTAGDFIGSFSQWDPSAAVEKLGQVKGAADGVLKSMSGNASASIEQAQRNIETATDQISGALAKAFGPELAKVADWVTQHQPEILGFFDKMVTFTVKGADAFLAFSSTSLRALATFAEGAGNTLEAVLQPSGKVAEIFGKLTGNKDLENFGKSVNDLQDKFKGVADGARSLADGIDNTARPKLAQFGQSIEDNITTAQNAEIMFRALGTTVAAMPDDHTITLTDNTPETTKRLEALGLKVTTLPDGTVKVDANTAAGQKILNDFITKNTGRTIDVDVNLDYQKATANGWRAPMVIPGQDGWHPGMVAPDGNANGNIYTGRDAQIANRPILWAEAGPEAYIPLGQSKRGRSTGLLAKVADMFGYSLTPMALGGIVPGKQFAQSVDSATYQLGGFSTSAMDCSGMVSATVNSALGRNPFESRMATGNEGEWLAALGAVSGRGGPGDMTIGWTTSGAAGGHTAMTLSDGTNVESNGAEGVVIGGPVGGASSMFDQFMHFGAAQLRGGDAGAGFGGTGAPGVSAGGANGGVGAGGAFDSSQIPAGVTPVWLVGSNATTPTADTGGTTPQNVTPTTPDTGGVQTLEEAWNSGVSKLQTAGQGFLSENLSDALGTMGLRTSGGVVQQISAAVAEKMGESIAAAIKQISAQQVAAVGRYSGRS